MISKTASLETTLQNMQKAIKKAGVSLEFSSAKHPLTNCYSLFVSASGAPQLYSNGKGTTQDAAMASALGEFIERFSTNLFFSDIYLPNRKCFADEELFDSIDEVLNEELLELYDTNGELTSEHLVDFNSDHKEQILALPFEEMRTKEKVYFPLNLLHNLYMSNGMASGNSPQEAQVQALSEIWERHAKFKIIENGYALPSFKDEDIHCFSGFYDDLQTLRSKGFIVEVLDASLGGEFPVTAISLINPANSTLFVSFGSHPIFEVSLERTMTELLQGRNLDELDAFEMPTFDMSLVADSINLESHFIDSNGKIGMSFLSKKKSFKLAKWSYGGNGIDDELNYLLLLAKGKKIYIKEFNQLGFYACQIIIPSISEVYPLEDLIYNNKNQAKKIRDMVLNFNDYDPQDVLEEIEILSDELSVGGHIGVVFEKEFSMAEFKAMVYMEIDEPLVAVSLLQTSRNKQSRLLAELLLMEEDGESLKNYEEALNALYSEELVKDTLAILRKEKPLISTTFHNNYNNLLAIIDIKH